MSNTELLQDILRFQFGFSASFHYLFVPLSMGLLFCSNVLATVHVFSTRRRAGLASNYWMRYFALTWVVGVLTGLPLRWQIHDVWSRYGEAARPVLQAIFSIEGSIAPLMMGGVFLITVCRSFLNDWVRMLLGWAVLMSMFWQAMTILAVNAWMQDPVGVSFQTGGWQLLSLHEVLFSDTALLKTTHALSAALLTGAMFVLAISCSHLIRRQHMDVARVSIVVASWTSALCVLVVAISGHASTAHVAKTQPMKFASLEAHWKSSTASLPLVLFAVPDLEHKLNGHELRVPGLLSWLLGDAVKSPLGILDLQEEAKIRVQQSLQNPKNDSQDGWRSIYEALSRQDPVAWERMTNNERLERVANAAVPPVRLTFGAFHLMVYSAVVTLLICAVLFVKRDSLARATSPRLLRVTRWAAILPFVATLGGWLTAESGRQPWVVYGHLTTMQASVGSSSEFGLNMLFVLLGGAILISILVLNIARRIFLRGPIEMDTRERCDGHRDLVSSH